MRRRHPTLGRRTLASCAAILAGATAMIAIVAPPASAVTNLYAPQVAGTSGSPAVAQFAVAADGTLSALAPLTLGAQPADIAVTPDGRFAYVTHSARGGITELERTAGGRMQAAGGIAPFSAVGILVNPQNTRVYYSSDESTNAVQSRPIDSNTGDLGPVTGVPAGLNATPQFLAMNPSGTSLYVGTAVDGPALILQFNVDPATGALTPKTPAFVPWPAAPAAAGAGANQAIPTTIARMSVTPDGGHLYAATGQNDTGIAHFAIDATGALVSGTVVADPADTAATSVAPISPEGQFLWAPTSGGTTPAGRIDRFSIAATGALTPLAPAAPYLSNIATRDAAVAPNGNTLYVGQDTNVGDWFVGANAALTLRANHAVPGLQNAGLALSPSQAPAASFTAAPQPAGQATTFNAAASTDPDGTVVRYDWDFGDGSALPNGGPAPSHVYAAPGAKTVTLTVTDADGTSTAKLWTGARMLRNGGPTAQVASTITIPPATVAPPPPPLGPLPDKNVSVTIVNVSGIVRVRLRGSSRYVDVRTLREIPLGSIIDARKGRVRITVEVNAVTHETQTAVYYDGRFRIAQTKGSKPFLVATLVGGSFKGCAPRTVSAASAPVRSASAGQRYEFAARRTKRSKRRVRRLWGRGDGDFRTTGRRSSATVRGTWWLVEDRCDGTLTRVRQGRVDVRDFRLKKTIKLRAGKRSIYLAKAP